MHARLGTLTGIVGAALLLPLLAACGTNAAAEPVAQQPLIASGSSVLHVERQPRGHFGAPATVGAGHASGEPLAGLVLFLAMRLAEHPPAAQLAATPCVSGRTVAWEHPRAARAPGAHRRDSAGCTSSG
ncbi:MAG TPA: hypothetical protein VME21_01370 [Steroidobacteraceae bacterium]|nr:hypothetical protein [Steroidobacteraceae bacterium]